MVKRCIFKVKFALNIELRAYGYSRQILTKSLLVSIWQSAWHWEMTRNKNILQLTLSTVDAIGRTIKTTKKQVTRPSF